MRWVRAPRQEWRQTYPACAVWAVLETPVHSGVDFETLHREFGTRPLTMTGSAVPSQGPTNIRIVVTKFARFGPRERVALKSEQFPMPEAMRSIIYRIFAEVLEEHVPGTEIPVLADESILLDCGLDSLGFAILVIRLEEELGFDPFLASDTAYYPKTFGEFVQFYEECEPQ